MSDSGLFRRLVRDLDDHPRLVLATCVGVRGSGPSRLGRHLLVRPDGTFHGTIGGGPFEALVLREAAEMFAARDRTRRRTFDFFPAGPDEPTPMICGGTAEVFFEMISSDPVLVIAGGGHVGQALARLAVDLDFRVVVVDDRSDYLQPDLFPDETLLLRVDRDFRFDLPRELIPRELLIALVTRCWETDEAALRHIASRADLHPRYIGMIGSRRKVREVQEHLRSAGLAPEFLEGLRAPIGLEIGAVTPAEIAVSILAEIVAVRSGTDVSRP